MASTVHVPTFLRETWNVASEMLLDRTRLLRERLVVTEKEVVSVDEYLLEARENQEVISESVVAAARDLRSLMGGVLFQRFVQISTIHYPCPFPSSPYGVVSHGSGVDGAVRCEPIGLHRGIAACGVAEAE